MDFCQSLYDSFATDSISLALLQVCQLKFDEQSAKSLLPGCRSFCLVDLLKLQYGNYVGKIFDLKSCGTCVRARSAS